MWWLAVPAIAGVTGFTLGFGTSKTADKLIDYAVIGGVLFIGYTMLKKKV